MPIRRNKSKAALAKVANTTALYEDLASTTVGDLILRVDALESTLIESEDLLLEISNLRNELNAAKNQALSTLLSIQNLANQINIKTISNEKAALQINNISTRLSIEIANSGIQI